MNGEGEVVLETVIKGDTVREVLDYVEFDVNHLVRKLRTDVETAVRDGRMDFQQSGRLLRFYEEGLQGYTYLEETREG
jgi:arginine decarboxylase